MPSQRATNGPEHEYGTSQAKHTATGACAFWPKPIDVARAAAGADHASTVYAVANAESTGYRIRRFYFGNGNPTPPGLRPLCCAKV
jgi:hypothetical protein